MNDMNDMNDISVPTVTIPQQEYDQLVKAQQFLLCLEWSGVDGWEGYSEAVTRLEEDE